MAAAGATPSAFEQITVSGRPVDVYLPACAGQAAPGSVPLVVSLHAWGTTAKTQQGVDNFAALAELECFAVAYPQGKVRAWGPFALGGFSWNAGGCCPNESDKGIDDVGFLANVTDAIRDQFPSVSRSLLFFSGLSNGGMMANRVACELPGVTAFAAVSGPLVNGTAEYGQPFTCRASPSAPVPILHIHGTADPVVPFGGCNDTFSSYGKACVDLRKLHDFAPFPNVSDYVAAWRARNGVGGAGVPARAGFANGSVACTSWGAERASNVTLCVARGEGHAWPGATGECGIKMFQCTLDMDASAEIWRFFGSFRNESSTAPPPSSSSSSLSASSSPSSSSSSSRVHDTSLNMQL
jgi:polyhydroxybutyrate depolymerase